MLSPDEFYRMMTRAIELKRIIRQGWKNKEVQNPESVAEHSWLVALMTAMFAKQLDLDAEKTLTMALIHDLGEAKVGDTIWERGAEPVGDRDAKQRDEHRAMVELFADTELADEFLALWEEFCEQETREARFVKLFDKLEMALQALVYQEEGNDSMSLDEFWINTMKWLKDTDMESYYRVLLEKSGRDWDEVLGAITPRSATR